jgi:hypothetical protein
MLLQGCAHRVDSLPHRRRRLCLHLAFAPPLPGRGGRTRPSTLFPEFPIHWRTRCAPAALCAVARFLCAVPAAPAAVATCAAAACGEGGDARRGQRRRGGRPG